MKLLLTGANGFIGRYFASTCQGRYSIQTFSFSRNDVEALHVEGVDVVLHLSALVHQQRASKEEYAKVNVNHTIALALKAKEAGVKHFIFMSTIAVYDASLSYIDESARVDPSTPYGRSKLEAEKKLQELADEFFTISIIRPPMVYGHNAPGNIKNLIRLVKCIPILPFGGVKNKRSFVYVGNLCAMIERIIQTRQGGIFLASDDAPLSTTRLIELIAKVENKKLYLLHVKVFGILLRWFKPALHRRLFCDLVVDNTQSKKVLDFKNPHVTEEGIVLMVSNNFSKF